jgi:hypothetical protein
MTDLEERLIFDQLLYQVCSVIQWPLNISGLVVNSK